jgi:acetylglutamate kinase
MPTLPTIASSPPDPTTPERLLVVKIGGNVLDSAEDLAAFLDDFAALPQKKILVHGGGKIATELASRLGLQTTMVEGRRITDEPMRDLVTMVYAGLISKSLVAALQARGCNAIGLCGADAALMLAQKRLPVLELGGVDFGFVGDVLADRINTGVLTMLLAAGITPICAPITHDGRGALLNTNADTIASAVAAALAERMHSSATVELVYCFEKSGVLLDLSDPDSLVPHLTNEMYQALRANGTIARGMIPKLDNAFAALRAGVSVVRICHARDVTTLAEDPPVQAYSSSHLANHAGTAVVLA